MAEPTPAAEALLVAFDETQLAEMHASACARIKRVRALHRQEYGDGSCAECTHEFHVSYPCPTIRALDGQEQPLGGVLPPGIGATKEHP